MCNCHFIPECCVMFSGVKLSIRSFNLFRQLQLHTTDKSNKITDSVRLGKG